ncbi:MAG: SCO family protein [Gemmatimonadetes bacterium]|nr:SCO family protein [Gemmatimonadota bacterium]|tara:strand:+ start:671 stop:1285 length:615 start_codon:yes stop_codon:yes gene_type:complete
MRYTKHLTLAVCLLFAGCSEPGDSTEPVAIVEEPQELPELKKLEFGRDFVLTDQNGERFDTVTLRGKLIFLFFGYTTCPDACPMTLSKIARVDALLGEIGERVQTVYVSVDPERDTVEKVREYLSYYDLPVVGLIGTVEEIKDVADDFGVYYSKSEEETALGYLVDHTTLVYMIDPNGTLRYLSHPDDSPEVLAALVRMVLAEG